MTVMYEHGFKHDQRDAEKNPRQRVNVCRNNAPTVPKATISRHENAQRDLPDWLFFQTYSLPPAV